MILLGLFSILVGRQQKVIKTYIGVEEADEQPSALEVHWSYAPGRRASEEGREPHPVDVLFDPVRYPDAFPGMVVQMVAVGEETGALDSMLSKIADFYEDEVEAAVKALTSILEPIMIIVVGGIVGFVVIAMYLPLFKVYDQIK